VRARVRTPSPAAPGRTGSDDRHRASGLLLLQEAIGNRAFGRVVARRAAPSSVDEADFNPDALVNDLRRAIDQSDTEVDGFEGDTGWTRRPIVVRSIHAEAVVKALEGRTPAQIDRIKALYSQLETGGKRTLEDDLFGKGESGYPSVLTRRPDWNRRIAGLMKGSRAETPGEGGTEGRLAADAAELAQLLTGDVGEADRERICALHRRDPAELDRLYAVFASAQGRDLDTVLNDKLPRPGHRNRVLQLRLGNRAVADAIAIEEKRLAIEALKSKERDPWEAHKVAGQRDALAKGIQGILDMNRQEAIADPANAGRTADQAVSERLDAILDVKAAEPGQTLGSTLYATLGPVGGLAIVATVDGTLVHAAATKLLQMELEGTTRTDKITPLLRGFRPQAQHDVVARASDPSVPEAERLALTSPIALERAVDAQAKEYTQAFIDAYEGMRGSGRSWQQIVDSADAHNTDLMTALVQGGGKLQDIDELDIAIRTRKAAGITAVLDRQPNQEAVTRLSQAYEAKRGVPLRSVLFGVYGSDAAARMPKRMTGALLGGRDAARAEEALTKPLRQGMHGQQEVDWIAAGGGREVEVTEANSGAMGSLREVGDDPETQVIMNESATRLTALKAEWDRHDPEGRPPQVILAEMRRVRAALTGDASAYEEENARMVEQLRSAVALAVQIALAIALPGGGGLIASTAMNIGASVATNMMIWGDDYTLDRFKGDVIGGLTGAIGGRLGEEFVGAIGSQVAGRTAKAAGEAAEQAGVAVGLGRQGAAAAQMADEAGIVLRAATEGGNVVGGAALTTAVTGENQLTWVNIAQGLAMNQVGKLGKRPPGAARGEALPAAGDAPAPVADGPAPAADLPAVVPAGDGPAAVSDPGALPDAAPRVPAADAPAAAADQVAVGTRPESGPARREARDLADGMEQLGSHWPGLDVEGRLTAMAPIVDRVLAPRDIPPVRVAEGEASNANGAVFDFPTWTLSIHPDYLHQASLPTRDAAEFGGLARHELEHAAQWWDMARMRAGEGHDATQIVADMGIPLDIAQQAVAAVGRDGPLTGQQLGDARAFWDSVYGPSGREELLAGREVLADMRAAVDARIAAAGGDAHADPADLHERQALDEQWAEARRAYRALPEEVRAYEVGDRSEAEAGAVEIERQADMAAVALEHVRQWERQVNDEVVAEVAAGREPDPELVAEHHDALDQLRALEDRVTAPAARRDALADESGGGPAPLTAFGPAGPGGGAAPVAGAAPRRPASGRLPGESTAPPRPPGVRPRIGDRLTSTVDAHSLHEAKVLYRDVLKAAPLHECALVFDPGTGVYHVVQGGPNSIELRSIRAEGLIVLRHAHPVKKGTDAAEGGDRFASTEDMGLLALATPPGEFRMEHIDFQVGGGEMGYTEFIVDKRDGRNIRCSVRVRIGGQVVFEREFPGLVAYQDFLGREFDAPGQLPENSTLFDPEGPDDF